MNPIQYGLPRFPQSPDDGQGGSQSPPGGANGAPAEGTKDTPSQGAGPTGSAQGGTKDGASQNSAAQGGRKSMLSSDGGDPGGKATGSGEKSGDGNAPEGADAPLEIKLPDGVTVDKGLLERFSPLAKEVGLDSDRASKLAAWYSEEVKAQEKALEAAWEKQSDTWYSALEKDAEFGGQKLAQNRADVARAITEFKADGLAKELGRLRVENNPEIVKFLARVGARLREDSSAGMTRDDGKGQRPNTPEGRRQKMYDHPDSARTRQG